MIAQQRYAVLATTMALFIFTLCSCTAEKNYTPVEVSIPVDTGCKIEFPEKPIWKADKLPPDAKISDKTKALILDLNAAKSYIAELTAATIACAN